MATSLQLSTGPLSDVDAGAVALLVPSDDEGRAAALAAMSEASGVDLGAALAAVDVTGKVGEVARIPVGGRLLIVSGLGEKPDEEVYRRAAATAVRNTPKDTTLAIGVSGDAAVVQAVAEGAGLGAYAYTEHRKKPHDAPTVETVTVVTADAVDEAEDAIARASVVVAAVCAARDMVNCPPGDKRPPALADRMAALVADADVTVRIRDEQELAEGGFGGIIGVGKGSSEPPRLVELTYAPEGATTHVVLVGKGITFDSGGLSLKPWKSMLTMKSDMAGAAGVAATMSALKDMGVTVKVTGLCALAENMPSATAQRPGDVIRHYGGTTVEVLNTDAEGRLVMADALAYGAEMSPDAMIDMATLTGAQVVSLGEDVAAVMGTDEALVQALRDAAETSGEQIWPLPLVERYTETLKSPVADMQNIGKAGHAGTITAGLFLRAFTGDIPWAHLDIAGPSFMEAPNENYLSAGGTGFGVRTLLTYLAGLS
ncbi:leucyl aminopeptidase [Euzebya rosea]|uniref:leucyl aminopeptidase n=1 Tax=Euzebya rosea TaxID=2052804 RepID=UPI000D3E8655|nr:leucyl aminopeptidase [Euzebya rosea]